MGRKQFKAESKRLLDLMINSIYTHREIFLRTTAAYACAFPLSKRKEVMDSELHSPMYISS